MGVQNVHTVEVLSEEVALAVRPNIAAKIRKLPGYLSESLIKLNILTFDREYTPGLRSPRQNIYIPVIAIERPTN